MLIHDNYQGKCIRNGEKLVYRVNYVNSVIPLVIGRVTALYHIPCYASISNGSSAGWRLYFSFDGSVLASPHTSSEKDYD
jgi:hypothetical protein